MKRNIRKGSSDRSMIASIAIGTGVGMTVSILLAVIGTALISNEKLAEELIGAMGVGIMAISAFICVQVGGRLAPEKKLLSGGGAALLYYLLLAAATILFFGGVFSGFGVGTVAFLVGCGASVLIMILPVKQGMRRNKIKFSR